jgi:hypothetical protein
VWFISLKYYPPSLKRKSAVKSQEENSIPSTSEITVADYE